MAKHKPAYFDSQASAAAALKIDIYRLRDAKAEGCTAFRSGRVYRDELLAWFEEKQSKAKNPDSDSLARAVEKTVRALGRRFELGTLSFEKYLAKGNAIVAILEDGTFEYSDMVLLFCGVTVRALRAKYPALEAPKGASRILKNWLKGLSHDRIKSDTSVASLA